MTDLPHRMYQQPWPEGEFRWVQNGFLVDDLLEHAARWAAVFGVGPFHVLPRKETTCIYRGTESTMEIQVAVAQDGPVQIELIQLFSDGPSVYRDLVRQGRSAFHQLSTLTFDFEHSKAHYVGLGFEVACEIVGPPHTAYFDTLDDFGFFTEIVEATPWFLGELEKIATTCADWDGTDPVRILTRDGYRTP